MDIREGLKKIKNTDNKLISGDNEIEYSEGVFWKKIDGCSQRLEYIPIEFEILDWKIRVPKPTLKDMLSKLKEVDFEYDGKNYHLFYEPDRKKWCCDFSVTMQCLGVVYYDEKSVKEVVKYMNDNNIDFMEFIKTLEEVRKERGE